MRSCRPTCGARRGWRACCRCCICTVCRRATFARRCPPCSALTAAGLLSQRDPAVDQDVDGRVRGLPPPRPARTGITRTCGRTGCTSPSGSRTSGCVRSCWSASAGWHEGGRGHRRRLPGEHGESWRTVLRDPTRRGLRAPVLAVGDGALGFWAAVGDVWPQSPSRTLASKARHAGRSCDAFRTRSTSTRCPLRSSSLVSSMVDRTLDAGSRGADVELRSRADRGASSRQARGPHVESRKGGSAVRSRRVRPRYPDGTGAGSQEEASEGRCHDRAVTASTRRCRRASRCRCQHPRVDAGIWR